MIGRNIVVIGAGTVTVLSGAFNLLIMIAIICISIHI